MRSIPHAIAAAFLVAITTTACDLPTSGNCEADQIIARFDGTFTVGGTDREIHREDPLASTNLPPADFRHVNDVLLEGGTAARGVVWSHLGIGTANDFFAFALDAPLRDGERRSVASTFQGGGWGPLDLGGSDASFALRLGDSWATSVQGEVTVVDATPLNLGVALTVALSDGSTVHLMGTDAFHYVRGTCRDARG